MSVCLSAVDPITQKIMQSHMIKISAGIAYEQNWPTGVASAVTAQFGFFLGGGGGKCIKKALYRIFFPTKVVTNHNTQLLCYVTFFAILLHFGVISASQICSMSVSRKYCAVLQNRFFYFLDHTKYKVLPRSKKRPRDLDGSLCFEGYWVQKSHFWHVICVSVYLSVCLS